MVSSLGSGLPFVALVQIDVSQDADWTDAFQLLLRTPGGYLSMPVPGPSGTTVTVPAAPLDLTGTDLEVVISPTFNDSRIISRFGSAINGAITIDDPKNGLCAFNVLQATMATLPAGQWQYIMRSNTAGLYADIMRGPFNIYPRAPF